MTKPETNEKRPGSLKLALFSFRKTGFRQLRETFPGFSSKELIRGCFISSRTRLHP